MTDPPQHGTFFPERAKAIEVMKELITVPYDAPLEEQLEARKALLVLKFMLEDIDEQTWWPEKPR